MKYYKILSDNTSEDPTPQLIEAPSTLVVDGTVIENPTEVQYLSLGWKRLYIGQTLPINQYYKNVLTYTELSTCIIGDYQQVLINDIQQLKNAKIRDVKKWDSSSNVNSFTISGISMWMDKNTRASLMFSIDSEMFAGYTETTIYTDSIPSYPLTIPIIIAKQFLTSLEVYAKECYATTINHINNINNLTNVNDILNYNFTIGYPEKLVFNLDTNNSEEPPLPVEPE